MIDVKSLTEADIGRNVVYRPHHALDGPVSEWEYGKLSSFRKDGSIFVRFKGPQGERCDPENLFWEFQ